MWWALLACTSVPIGPAEPGFPYDVVDEPDRPAFVDARVETETWTPGVDPERTALYIQKALEHYTSAPEAVVDHFDAQRAGVPPPAPSAPLRLQFAGDLLPVSGAGSNRSLLAEPVVTLFDADMTVANLETPTAPALDTQGIYALNADPSILDSLPFDLLQVNNNHSLDAGTEGLDTTVAEIEARGIVPFGHAGPIRREVSGVTVAFLPYTWGLNVDPGDLRGALGVVPFGHPGAVDLKVVADDIRTQREAGAELVVVMPHWGYEYEYYPDRQFLVLGRELVAMGADLVVGHGPHVAQPVEVCDVLRHPPRVETPGACQLVGADGPRTAAIVYSVGNASGNVSMKTSWPLRTGITVQVDLDPDEGVVGLGWTPLFTADADWTGAPHDQVAPLDDPPPGLPDDQRELLREESDRLDAHLGAHWRY